MKTKKPIYQILMVAIFVFAIIDTSLSQENLQNVGQWTYAQFDGVWYTIANGNQGDLVDTNHVLVRLKGKADISTFDFEQAGLPNLKNVRGRFADGFYEFEIPNGADPFETARKLYETGRFDELFFNVFLNVDVIPNDPLHSNQWNLPKIIMSQTWDITTGSSSIVVAVIDVGGDHAHEDLLGNRWAGIGYNFYNNNSNPYPSDGAGHGTAVAGILGAVTNNGLGVAGVGGGWSGSGGIRIMHLRAGYRFWDGQQWRELISISAASQATDYAASNGARVINMSFGGHSPLPTLESAINNAVNNYGVVVVASAGNYRAGEPTGISYPARYSNVICVGATTPSDTRKELNDGTESWWGSCYGQELDVMAPGVYIRTTDLTGTIGYSTGNYFDSFNGTSSAAPHVAGLAALIRSVNPSLTWQQVRDILRNTADDKGPAGFDIEYGYGRINTLRAIGTAYVTNHPDYEFVYNNVSLSYYNNANMVFLAGPNWCNSAGTYYNTERHRLLIEVNRSFTHTPLAWYLGPVGYSWANPNNATSWLSQTVNVNTIRYETVFYRLNQGNLSCENRWAPFDPNTRERAYAYLGRPLVAPIISHFTQNPDPICKGTTGWVTAHLSQGNPNQCTWTWEAIDKPAGVVVTGQGQYCSIYYPYSSAALNPMAPVFQLKCTASISGFPSSIRYYTPRGNADCSGCPTLAFNVDGEMTDDNPLLITSLSNPGMDVTDYYLVQNPITPVGDKINLRIHEPQTEHTWLDYVELIEAKVKRDELVAVNDEGEIINYKKLSSPVTVLLNGATDITFLLAEIDTLDITLTEGDVLTIQRSSLSAGDGEDEDIIVGGIVPIKDLESITLRLGKKGDNNEDNPRFGGIFLRPNKSIMAKKLRNLPPGDIEIVINKTLTLDYLTIAKNIKTAEVKSLDLLSANHSTAGNVKALLSGIDQNYAEIIPGEIIDFEFKKGNTPAEKTAYILKSVGRYETDTTLAFNKLTSLVQEEIIPKENKLFDNYPNPFNPTTQIKYSVKENGMVTLKVYDVLGKEVASLVNEEKQAGTYTITFDAGNLASGIYFYTISSNDFHQTKKMLLIK